jgi:hypothetical protein
LQPLARSDILVCTASLDYALCTSPEFDVRQPRCIIGTHIGRTETAGVSLHRAITLAPQYRSRAGWNYTSIPHNAQVGLRGSHPGFGDAESDDDMPQLLAGIKTQIGPHGPICVLVAETAA